MIQLIDDRPHVRPCASIPPDGNEGNDWIVSISKLYAGLTRPLSLAGAMAVAPQPRGGEARLAAQLRAEMPWMAAAIDRIADQQALGWWGGRPWLALRPLLLAGPPGAGKTHFAKRLGELSGCGDAILSLAGVSSNAELAGNPRGFRHPQPCFPALAMMRTGTANPVVVIDEAEKACAGSMGDPTGTLLGMLERSTSRRWFDGCLMAELDLAHVNWVLTASSLANLPAPLLSRVDVVEVAGPGPDHAEVLLASLWRAVARDARLSPSAIPRLEAAAEPMLLRLFRNTRSVRRLRRAIETVVAVSARAGARAMH